MVVMNAGRIEQIGRPLDVYDHPETLYVAQFIGSPAINVWRGSVDGGALRTEPGAALALSAGAPAGLSIAAAFRPEHVEIDPAGTLAARVDVVETLGPETYVYMDAEGMPVCARVDRSRRLAPGDAVRLRIAPHAVHLFGANGRRLAG
jgi:multiple sugar transport system ATP-binding protein